MSHLVGTLVKHDNFGNLRPYLAETIETSDNKKIWNFKLRKGLECEDGEPITAQSYAQVLTKQLLKYRAAGPILEFEKLKGVKDFNPTSEANLIPGITFSRDTLTLSFTSPPELLLERLGDPYFGYICSNNFASDGETWLDEDKIASSGLFRLIRNEGGRTLKIEKRREFPLSESTRIDRAEIELIQDFNNIRKNYAYLHLTSTLPNIENFNLVKGSPTFSVILSAPQSKSQHLESTMLRKKFFDLFFKYKNENQFDSDSMTPTNTFFSLQKNKLLENLYRSETSLETQKFVKKPKLVVAMSSSLSPEYVDYINKILNKISDEMNFDFERYSKKVHGPWPPGEPAPFDLRLISVDVGSKAYFSLLDMVYCSELGARFPDRSGEMCRFTKKGLTNERGSDPLTTTEEAKFYNLVYKSHAVLPVHHRSFSHMFSPEVDLDSVSGSILYPQLDLIRFDQ